MTAVTNFNYCLKYIIVGDSCKLTFKYLEKIISIKKNLF